MTQSGTSAARIVYRGVPAAGGAMPQIYAISGGTANYIAIIGLQFTQPSGSAAAYASTPGIRLQGCKGWLIEDNYFFQTYGVPIDLHYGTVNTYNVIRGNRFDQIGYNTSINYLVGNDLINLSGNHNLVEYNVFGLGMHRVYTYSADTIIRNNLDTGTSETLFPNSVPNPEHIDDVHGGYAPNTGTLVTAGSFTVGELYLIQSIGTTDFTAIGAAANTTGTFFVATGIGTGTGTAYNLLSTSSTSLSAGQTYQITFTGTTDFTSVGAAANTPGTYFVATGTAAGTGTAAPIFAPTRNVIERNFWDENAGKNGHNELFQDEIGSGSGATASGYTAGIVIRQNVAAWTGSYFVASDEGTQHTRIFNNTVVGTLAAVFANDGVSAPFVGTVTFSTPTNSDIDARNNIFYNNHLNGPPGVLDATATTGFTAENNDVAGSSTLYTSILGAAELTSSPLLNSPTAPTTTPNASYFASISNQIAAGGGNYAVQGIDDFTLSGSSPAIASGTYLTTAAAAGSGTTLVVNDATGFCDGFGIEGQNDGDLIKVGSNGYVRVTAVNYATNTLTLASGIAWNAGDPVILQGMEDLGAEPSEYVATPTVVNTTTGTLSTATSGSSVSLTATTTTPNAIRYVEFLVDGTPVGVAHSAPYSVTWIADGNNHDVEARAYNAWASKTLWVSDYNTAPHFATQPSSLLNVTQGTTANFSGSLAAIPYSVSYQWQKNGSNLSDGATGNGSTIAGSHTASLSITSVAPQDAGSYTLVATDTLAVTGQSISTTSTAATLSVAIPAAVTTPPASSTTTYGGTASFTVAASGTPAPTTYTWYSSAAPTTPLTAGTDAAGSTLAGTNSATLQISNAQIGDNGVTYYVVVSNGYGSPAQSSSATLTVNPANQSIAFHLGALATQTFSPEATFSLLGTATGGGSGEPIAFSVPPDNGVASISGSTVTLLGAGTVTITANQAGNSDYNAAPAVTQTLVVNPASQSITFSLGALASVVYSPGRTIDLAGTATGGASGEPVTFSVSTDNVITISGTTATIVGAGTVTITANEAGTANYSAAPPVTQLLTVTAAPQVISFSLDTIGNVAYGPSKTVSLSGTATGGGSGNAVSFSVPENNGVATINGNTLTVVGVGSVQITANQSGNGDYNAATAVTETLVVTQAPQTITFSLGGLAGQTFVPNATFSLAGLATGGPSGNPVTFSVPDNNGVASVNGTTVTLLGVGTVEITANQAGNADYAAAAPVQSLLTVTPGSPVITSDNSATATVDSAFNFNVVASNDPSSYSATGLPSGLSINLGTGDITGTPVTAGDYYVDLNATNILGTGSQVLNLVVEPIVAPTVTSATSAAATIGQSFSFQVTATNYPTSFSASGLPDGLTISASTGEISGVPLTTGSALVTVTATNIVGSTSAPLTITVNELPQTVTFSPIPSLYVNETVALNATSSAGLPVEFRILSGNATITSGNLLTVADTNPVEVEALALGNDQYASVWVTQTVTASGTAQAFFGQLGSGSSRATTGNSFAAYITGNSGTVVGYIAGQQIGFFAPFTLTNGAFSVVASAVSSTAASGEQLTISGNLSGGVLSGTIQPLGVTFTAPVDPSSGTSAQLSGLYAAGSTYSVVGTQGELFVLAVTPGLVTGGSGTIDANGGFSVTTTQGAAITGSLSVASGITGSISLPGGGSINYTGAANGLAPQIAPPSQSVSAGANVDLAVTVTGATAYQWQYYGASIPGATGATYTIPNIGEYQGGLYSVLVTTAGGTVSSIPASVSVNVAASLANLSARASVTATQPMTAGFIIAGSGSKSVLIRGIGPALANFGVADPLGGTSLTLYDNTSAAIATDAGWGNQPVVGPSISGASASMATSEVFTSVGAFALPAGSADSALLATFAESGSYSAVVSQSGGTPGVALTELYDTDPSAASAYLSNISCLSFSGTGQYVATVGFSISGTTSETILLRGIGPALAGFGVAGAIAQPQLTLFDHAGNTIATNVGWGNPPLAGNSSVPAGLASATTQIMNRVYAFALPADSDDCAMVVTLPPGVYSATVTGTNGTTGVALVEAYAVP